MQAVKIVFIKIIQNLRVRGGLLQSCLSTSHDLLGDKRPPPGPLYLSSFGNADGHSALIHDGFNILGPLVNLESPYEGYFTECITHATRLERDLCPTCTQANCACDTQ